MNSPHNPVSGCRTLVLVATVTLTWSLPAQEPAAPPAKPEDTCAVEGNIYSAKSGEPLNKAEVKLEGGTPPMQYGATTDASGHFAFDNVDPGSYNLWADRNGYVVTHYPNKSKRVGSTIITLAPGKRLKDLAVRMAPQGVVTGRVVDEDGEPLPNVEVRLVQPRVKAGRRTLGSVAYASTNDKGEYRLYGVARGRYFVSANAHDQFASWFPFELRSDKSDQLSFRLIYYPNALSASDGGAIEVGPGAELAGIDFRLEKTRLLAIRGRIVDQGLYQRSKVWLIPVDADGETQWEQMKLVQTDDNGNFTYRDLLPGLYHLQAFNRVGETANSAYAKVVVVADADVEGLQLAFGNRREIGGTVLIEGSSEPIKQSIRLGLESEDKWSRDFGGTVKEDGTFKLKDVPLERMRLAGLELPEGYYLKSVRHEGREREDASLDFSEGVSGELAVILSPNAATVTGFAKPLKDEQVTMGIVVLVPENRKRKDLFFSGGVDQNGAYKINNIHPGSYKIFAFDDIESSPFQDPEWLKQHEEKGEPIVLKECAKLTKDLTLIVTEEDE